jgi:hypothetical protein
MAQSSIQPDLVSLQSKLTAEIRRDEKELETTSKRIEKNRELLHAVNGSLGALLAQETGFTNMADTIRAAIKAIGKPRFTSVEVDNSLLKNFPTVAIDKDSVRSALWNMQKRAEIVCVRKGTSLVPAEYESADKGGDSSHGAPSGAPVRKRTRPAFKDLLPTNGAAG